MSKRIVPILIAISVIAGAGYWWWNAYGPGSSASDDALSGTGTIEAEQVVITPQTNGRIVEMPVAEGASVKAGDVLATIDPSLLQLQLDQAEAGVDAAKRNYEHVKNDDDSNKAERAAAKAQYDQAKAARDMAKVQLGWTTVASPIDGVLSSVPASVGENAVMGSTLAVVSDLSNLTITIFVPESRIGQVELGQEGEFTTDSTDTAYHGKVTFIASQAEFTPASIETKDQRVKLVYQVWLSIIDADASLKPGMLADVVLR
jgi:HlyD family secretion protein